MAPLCETSTPNLLAPPAVRLPKLVAGAGFAFFRTTAMRHWIRKHGRIFEINVPFFGRSVVVSDPALVRGVCTASAEQLINVEPSVGNWFGTGSTFGLDGDPHRDRRQLLAPAFHGQSLQRFGELVEEETRREFANWPDNQEFRTLEPMNRITLNVILRTILCADADELDELGKIIGPYMKLGQLLAFVPRPPCRIARYGPWRRLDELRNAFDRNVLKLIAEAEADPRLGERTDTLAFLVRGIRDKADLCDELMTLVCAGHETTASTLAWTFERLRRHPHVLAELVNEVDEGGCAFRMATIAEAQRVRPAIDVFGRRVASPYLDLGGWRIPHGRTVLVRIADVHNNPDVFDEPAISDPHRFRDAKPTAPAWLAFGGGARRCIGAGFAIAEIDIVLRTVLRNFTIQADAAGDEKSRFRGIAHVPALGGVVVMNRRT